MHIVSVVVSSFLITALSQAQSEASAQPADPSLQPSAQATSEAEERGLPGQRPGTERWIVQFRKRTFDLDAFRDANLRNAGPGEVAPIVAGLEASMRADQAAFVGHVERLGGTVVQQWWLINGCAIEVPPAAIAGLRAHPNVLSVEPDRMHEPCRTVPVALPILTATNANNHNADVVQAAGIRGLGVGCAIMDTGQDSASAALGRPHLTYYSDGNVAVASGGIGGSRLMANKKIGAQPADDVHGHGTGCAGIAAGGKWNGNANSDHGHAPQASIIGYAIADNTAGSASGTTMTTAWQAIAADKATYTTVTANNSYSGSPNPLDAVQVALDSAAYNANILIAVAAGNNGTSTAASQSAANGIAVAASSATSKVIAGFSCKGPLSGDVTRHYPDITGCGVSTVMPLRDAEANATGYVGSGTSMASPQVCGAATLYRSKKPSASALETKAALLATTEDIAAQNPSGTREWYGLGFLRDDSLIDVAKGNAVVINSNLTTGALSKTFCVRVQAAKKYSVVLAWHRQNLATTAWTNMGLSVVQGSTYSSNDPRNLYERVIFTASATTTATITVSAPSLEAGQTSVAFSVVVPGATSCTPTAYSPAPYAAVEATSNNVFPFGGATSFSYEQVHPDLRGVPLTVNRLSLRRDGPAPTAGHPARSVTLALYMGGANAAATTTNFLGNYATARTTVVAAKTILLPDLSINLGSPSPTWDVQLPLDVPFAWAGTHDFLWEARVTATNAATYPMDAATGVDAAVGNGVSYGASCVAAGKATPHTASVAFTTSTFANTLT